MSSNDVLALLAYLFGALAVTSSIYSLIAVFAAFRFRRSLAAKSASTRARASVLIPVAGSEARLVSNLEAALAALSPGDELLVGAASAEDPALDAAREVARRHPSAPLVIVAGSPSLATNRKVATLEALEARAQGAILVLVDSDVRLDRDLLGRLTGALEDAVSTGPTVGVATALYRGVPQGGFASRIEALAINADFVPSVLVADTLGGGIQFALGAANAVRREALQAIGGIGSLGEVLADDHHLGKRIVAKGYRVAIAPAVVPIVQDSSVADTFARLLRWCRTVRVCQPVGYAATIVSHHGVAASLAAFGLATIVAGVVPGWAPALLGITVALRLVTAASAHRLIAGADADFSSFALLPVRDLIATALFAIAWTGRAVTWRGRRFQVLADGTLRLTPTHTAASSSEVSQRSTRIPLPLLTAGGS